MCSILSVVLAVLLGVTTATTASVALGHDGSCGQALVEVRLEDAPLPPGWVWRELDLGPAGWSGRAEWTGGDIRAAELALACADDVARLLARRAEVRDALAYQRLELDEFIGEAAAAWVRSPPGSITLEWQSRGVLGSVRGEWNASLHDLAGIARSIDASLP